MGRLLGYNAVVVFTFIAFACVTTAISYVLAVSVALPFAPFVINGRNLFGFRMGAGFAGISPLACLGAGRLNGNYAVVPAVILCFIRAAIRKTGAGVAGIVFGSPIAPIVVGGFYDLILGRITIRAVVGKNTLFGAGGSFGFGKSAPIMLFHAVALTNRADHFVLVFGRIGPFAPFVYAVILLSAVSLTGAGVRIVAIVFPTVPIVIKRCYAVGLGCVTIRAGVGNNALFGAGGNLGLYAVVPLMRLGFVCGTAVIAASADVFIGSIVFYPITKGMLVRDTLFCVACIVLTNAFFLSGIVACLPFAPIVSDRGDLLGIGVGFELATACNTLVSDYTRFLAGGGLGYGAFIVNALVPPLICGTWEFATASYMLPDSRLCCADVIFRARPFAPFVLLVRGRTLTYGTVYNVMYTVLCLFPEVGISVIVLLSGVKFVIFSFAIGAGYPVTELYVFGFGSASLFFVLCVAGKIECVAILCGTNALVLFIVDLGPGTPAMSMSYHSCIGGIKVDRDLSSLDLLPEAFGGDNEILIFAVYKEAKPVLDLAPIVFTAERFGVKDRRVIGVIRKQLGAVFIHFLNFLGEQNAPKLAVAKIIALAVVVVIDSNHRAYPEVRYTEVEIVFVIPFCLAVAEILRFDLFIGITAIHYELKCVKILYRDISFGIGSNLDNIQRAHVDHITVGVLHFELEKILLNFVPVKHTVEAVLAPEAVERHSVGNTVAVGIHLKNICNAVAILVDSEYIGVSVLVGICVNVILGHFQNVIILAAVAIVDLGNRNKGRARSDRGELIVRAYLRVYGNRSVAVFAFGFAVIMSKRGNYGEAFEGRLAVFIVKISHTELAIPIFLTALVHAGGRNVSGIFGRDMSAGRRIKICGYGNFFVVIVFIGYVEKRKALGSVGCSIKIQSTAYPFVGIVVPIDVAVVHITASVAVCVPQSARIAIGLVTAVIFDSAKPFFAVIFKRYRQTEHNISVEEETGGAAPFTGERIHLVLHRADVCAVGDVRKGVGFGIPIFGNVNCGYRVKAAISANVGMRESIKSAPAFNNV